MAKNTKNRRSWTPKTLYKHVAGFVKDSHLDPKTATIEELFEALKDAEFEDIDLPGADSGTS